MKVPHSFTGQTRASSQGLQGFNVQYNPNDFGAALGPALDGFGAALEVAQERREKNERFDTLTDFTNFETNVKLEIEKLKQETPEDAANFFERAEAVYDNAASGFLNEVPPELQKEFESRAAQIKQGVVFDTFKFDFEQQNLFFTDKITDTLSDLKVQLDLNPAALEEKREYILDLIDSSGLPEMEKARQRELSQAALEAITYKSEVRKARSRELRAPSGGVVARDLPPQAAGVLSAIAKRESGGKYDIRYGGETISNFVDHPRKGRVITEGSHKGQTSTAAGKYQFIASTWDMAAEGAGVQDFSPESQDRAAWYWAQKTYRDTYGEDLSVAIAEGKFAQIKNALGTQWAGVKHMSLDEFIQEFDAGSGSYVDYAAIEGDGRFANLPFEDRQAIKKDAYSEAQSEYNSLIEQQQALEEQRINDLYVGLFDGAKGQADINALRDEGILRDYDDINKAQKILDDRLGDQTALTEAQNKLLRGSLWVEEDEADRKRANALFGEHGRSALEEGSQDYVQQTLLPRYEKMGMAAPDMVNTLVAMSRANNAESAAFAFETLRQMREQQPIAFGTQFGEQVQKQVDFWELRRNYFEPEELVGQIQNRGVDQASRQAQSVLRAEGKELAKEVGLEDIQPLYESIIPWYSADLPINPRGRTLLEREYRALFTDAYVQYGNEEEAKAAANKQIARVWAPTRIGGSIRVAKFPPELAGYQPRNGSFDWIDRQVRREMKFVEPTGDLDRDIQFELMSDETTEMEIAKRMQEMNSPDVKELTRPSYLISYKDESGAVAVATDDRGRPLRIDFLVDKQTLAEEESEFRRKQQIADREYIRRKWQKAEQNRALHGEPIPPALEESMRQVEAEEEQEQGEMIRGTLKEQERALERVQNPFGDR